MTGKMLTVFTPTFNRAHTLQRTYDSLLSQTSSDFEWLIVDDGSSDGTRDLVEGWKREGRIPITYIYQENQGMLGAHNTALQAFKTELFVCLDSDDYFPADAVSTIISLWRTVGATEGCGGIVGLDVDTNGDVIGDKFPKGVDFLNFMDIKFRYKIRGDKKYVMSREAIEYAGLYPVIEGEHFPDVSYLYRVMAEKYSFFVHNEPLCIVDYQADGITRGKFRQYARHPNAFMHHRLLCMDKPYDLKEKFWAAGHFVSSAIYARKLGSIFTNRHRAVTISAIPLGIAMWGYTIGMRILRRMRDQK